MTCDLPCMSYMALYVISMHIVSSNSRSSTHWRLNQAGKVVQDDKSTEAEDDSLMNILTSKVVEDGEWRVEGHLRKGTCSSRSCDDVKETPKRSEEKRKEKGPRLLTCGKAVNGTDYDHLLGIASRHVAQHIPEPEVAMVFRKKGSKTSELDMTELEERLWKAKQNKPKSAQVYNDIGNFWRIRGNTQLSIECFRKALSIAPNKPEVLLNLARVLFNLRFLDDAIFLTRRSLMMPPQEKETWLHHFTLGEILKAYGHEQEASFHFKHTLELNPGFQPAEAYLRDMDITSSPTVTQYTLFIILFLVLGVLFGVVTSIEANYEDLSEVKTQRHFNRAMAMRSMKLGINPRLIRMRKLNC